MRKIAARAVHVKMRDVKILRIVQITMCTAQVSMRIAQCVVQKLYGNRNFQLEKLYSLEITTTFSFITSSSALACQDMVEKTIILERETIVA